jgi:glycosyltransferase involved in cell wall biosynthesis
VNTPLPISLLLPVYECKSILYHDLERIKELATICNEVIIVDSHSGDESGLFLQQAITKAKLYQTPRGIYKAWNEGIKVINQPYTYICTAGDGVNVAGLKQLYETMISLQANVIISSPRKVIESRISVHHRDWPIEVLMDLFQWQRVQVISAEFALLWSYIYISGSLFGSAASNLFQTNLLKNNPFPENIGHSADTTWFLATLPQMKIGIHHQVISDFLVHEQAGVIDDHHQNDYLNRVHANYSLIELMRDKFVAEDLELLSKTALLEKKHLGAFLRKLILPKIKKLKNPKVIEVQNIILTEMNNIILKIKQNPNYSIVTKDHLFKKMEQKFRHLRKRIF